MGDTYEIAFELILHAGNAKSNAMMAVSAARKFDFDVAEQQLLKSEEESTMAHTTQTKLIQKEANGGKIEVDLILVHAQDHLNGAMIAYEQAKELIHIYKLLSMLLKEKNYECNG